MDSRVSEKMLRLAYEKEAYEVEKQENEERADRMKQSSENDRRKDRKTEGCLIMSANI